MSSWNDIKKNIISLSQEDWEEVELKVKVSEEMMGEQVKQGLPKESLRN